MPNIKEIKSVIFQWLSQTLGTVHVFKIIFNQEFVADNLIKVSLDGEQIKPVTFETDHETTINKLAQAIKKTNPIFNCKVTEKLELTCYGSIKGNTINVIGPEVSNGNIQPKAFINDIEKATLIKVIDLDKPENIEKPYGAFQLVSEKPVGLADAFLGYSPEGFLQRGGQRTLTVTVQFWGAEAFEWIHVIRHSLQLQTTLDYFYNGYTMAFVKAEESSNLTKTTEMKTEDLAQINLIFTYVENYEEDIPWIETVELEGNIGEMKIKDIIELK